MINSGELLDFAVQLIEGYKLEVDPENYLRENVKARGLSGSDSLQIDNRFIDINFIQLKMNKSFLLLKYFPALISSKHSRESLQVQKQLSFFLLFLIRNDIFE